MARKANGTDADGYRSEFIRLVELSELIDTQLKSPLKTTPDYEEGITREFPGIICFSSKT
jgi:hypothetical protein